MKELFLIILICFFALRGICQTQMSREDSAQTALYRMTGDSLYKNSYYPQAIEFYEKTQKLYLKYNLYEKYCDLEFFNIWGLIRNGSSQLAERRAKQWQNDIGNQLGKKHFQAGRAFFILGNLYLTTKVTHSAIENYAKSVDIFVNSGLPESKSWINYGYQNLSSCYRLLGDYDLALKFNSKIDPYTFGRDYEIAVSRISYNNAIIYAELGDSEKATQLLNKGINILNNQNIDISRLPVYSSLLLGVGLVKISLGENYTAQYYLSQSVNHIIGIYGKNHRRLIPVYGNLGTVFRNLENHDSSLYYYNKVLIEQDIHYKKPTVDIASTYEGIALNYLEKKEYNTAIEFQEKALLVLKGLDFKGIELPKSFAQLGTIYIEKGDDQRAREYFKQSIDLYKEHFGKIQPSKAVPYIEMSKIEKDNRNYEKALMLLQSALSCNVDSFESSSIYDHSPTKGYYHQLLYLETLALRADVFRHKFIEDNNVKDLEASLKTYGLCDDILNNIRLSYQSFEDKVKFQSQFSSIYNAAVETILLALDHYDDPKYLTKYFYYVEKSKVGILTGSLSDHQARKISNISDSLLSVERTVKIRLTFYKNELVKERYDNKGKDSLKIATYEKRFFNLIISMIL